MQGCSNAIANALEILQSCTKPTIWCTKMYSGYQIQSNAVLTRSNIARCVSYSTALTEAEYKLWGVFCDDSVDDWPRCNGTALYTNTTLQWSHMSAITSQIAGTKLDCLVNSSSRLISREHQISSLLDLCKGMHRWIPVQRANYAGTITYHGVICNGWIILDLRLELKEIVH